MKHVNIREFQRSASKHMKDFPFAITRYNKVVAVIVSKEQASDWLKDKVDIYEE